MRVMSVDVYDVQFGRTELTSFCTSNGRPLVQKKHPVDVLVPTGIKKEYKIRKITRMSMKSFCNTQR